MSHPLDGPFAKLDRAAEHLETLRGAVDGFLLSKPYVTSLKVNAQTTQKEQWIEVQPVPTPIGVIVGDVVHNLRSSLDHLAWQLGSLKGKPGKECQFPIFTDEEEFKRGRLGRGGKRGRAGISMIKSIKPQAARALVEEVQPYNKRGRIWLRRSLWTLNVLSNVDKHRVLVPSPIGIHHAGANSSEIVLLPGPYEGKAVFATAPGHVRDEDMVVEVALQLVLHVPDEELSSADSVVPDLQVCGQAVRFIVNETMARGLFPPRP